MTDTDRERLFKALEIVNDVIDDNNLSDVEHGDLIECRDWLEPIATDSYSEWEVNPDIDPPTEVIE